MKKTLLIIINFVLSVTSLQAQILYNFNQADEQLSGVTIFKFLPATNELKAVKSVEWYDGLTPSGSMVEATNRKLYGLTTNGGTNRSGVIFSFDPSSSTYTKLKDFDGVDGGTPHGSVIQASDGKLYGTAGVIFSVDPSDSTYAKLHEFNYVNDGNSPSGSLVQARDGKLYGMTRSGGVDFGVIFSFDPATSTYAKLHDFDYFNDGGSPEGSLIQASNGKLYGMTSTGGTNGFGVIFSFDPSFSTYTKLKELDYADGTYPRGSLVQASNGKLYGMTSRGGSFGAESLGYGVIFSLDPSTSNYVKLHDFEVYYDGRNPQGTLMQASDGKLYGTTSGGGDGNLGTIFSFDPFTFKFTKLIDYNGINGYGPGVGNAFVEVSECIEADSTWYKDADGDGYGNPTYRVKACPRPAGYVADSTDCNDNNKAIHPGMYYRDCDRDGFGDPYHPISVCSDMAPAGYVKNNYDCYDLEGSSDPGYVRIRMCNYGWTQCVYAKDTAEKLSQGWSLGLCPLQSCTADETLMCHNGKQECVRTTDVAAKLADTTGSWSLGPFCSGVPISACNEADTTYYRDYDRDGFGDPDHPISASTCALPAGYVYNNTDCNDSNQAVHGPVTWYRDLDHDGFGDPNHSIITCSDTPLAGYVKNNYDCYDGEGSGSDSTAIVTVPGTSNPWLAGMPDGTQSEAGDVAPANSPVLATIKIRGGSWVEVSESTGAVAHGAQYWTVGPEGCLSLGQCNFEQFIISHAIGTEHGKSSLTAPINSLIAVFLNDGIPTNPVPESLDFSTQSSRNYLNLYPKLQQVFFIGNGRTDDGAVQKIFIPKEATRLYLGTMDGGEWNNNIGRFCVALKVVGNSSITDWYKDADGDGYGNPELRVDASTQPAGYVADHTDCNDNNKAIHAPIIYYRDDDRDGFGDSYNPISACSIMSPAGYVRNNYDCYDHEVASDPGYVRIRMCHDGWTQCVYAKDTAEKINLGWTVGICPLQSCAADETLMCHNGKQECVKTNEVAEKLGEAGGKWSLGPFCSGVPISGSGSNTVRKIEMAGMTKSTPAQYSLSNHPNPFAGTSTIKYELPFDSKVSIKVYDMIGRTVATLVDEYKKAGTYTVNFNAGNLSSGSLFYKIIASSKEGLFERTNQMVKIK